MGKNSPPKKRTQQKMKVGGLNMTPQGQLPSPQASNGAEETEEMQEV